MMSQRTQHIALNIVLALQRKYPHLCNDVYWDEDEAAHIVDCFLPESVAETEEEWRKFSEQFKISRPPGPSLFSQVKTKLGVSEDCPLREVLKLIVKRLQELEELRCLKLIKDVLVSKEKNHA